MRLLLIITFLCLPLAAYATTYSIGPGKTYTNIGDAPWSSLNPGDTVLVYPKTPLTAVTTGSSTAITFTATLTNGSAVLASVSSMANLWPNQLVTCSVSGAAVVDDAIAPGGIGSGTITLITAASASGTGTCTAQGSVVTLTTSAASIPFGSTVWYAGIASSACGVYSGKYGTPSGGFLCTINTMTTCGAQGSGLYSTSKGGAACVGDVVGIFDPLSIPSGTTLYFYPPYFEKIVMTATGTSGSELTVEGVPDPTTGVIPALDANYATTGPNMAHAGATQYHDISGANLMTLNSGATGYPAYVTMEFLRFQNASYLEYFYDGSNTQWQYGSGVAGMRFEDVDHVLFKNNELVDNNNGTFGASNGGIPATFTASNLTLTNLDIYGNHYYWNGSDLGGVYSHASYLEGTNLTYEFNYYDVCANNDQLKDRSSGTVVRYNYFDPCGRSVDLVDAQNSFYINVPQNALNVPNAGIAAGATTLTFTPITITGDTTNGSSTIANLSSVTGLVQGTVCTGAGVAAGSSLWGESGSSPGSSGFFTKPATATATGVTLTCNTVAGINAGDMVGYYASTNGWGYSGTGAPVMPTVASVNSGTDTITLSGGMPASIGQWTANFAYAQYTDIFINVSGTWYEYSATTAGTSGSSAPSWCTTTSCTVTDGTVTWTEQFQAAPVLTVISQQLNQYKQTFVYGNVFNLNQNLMFQGPYPEGTAVHYGWDTNLGSDSVSDRAGTLYFYDNTFIGQWDASGSVNPAPSQAIFETESNADNIYSANNVFYATNAPSSGNPATYFVLLGESSFTYTPPQTYVASVYLTGGNNQIAESPSIGSNTCSSLTETGWAVCSPPEILNSTGASADVSNISTKTQAALYPSGITDALFKLQAGSSAISAASSLPSAITSNTLGLNLTPAYQPDGTARSTLVDLGAWQYTAPSGMGTVFTGITLKGITIGAPQ